MTQTRMEPLLLTVDQAAWHLSCSRAHAYRLIQHGHLPTVAVGRSRRIAMEDLRAFIDGLRQKARDGSDEEV